MDVMMTDLGFGVCGGFAKEKRKKKWGFRDPLNRTRGDTKDEKKNGGKVQKRKGCGAGRLEHGAPPVLGGAETEFVGRRPLLFQLLLVEFECFAPETLHLLASVILR
jgi:hypothetical protein